MCSEGGGKCSCLGELAMGLLPLILVNRISGVFNGIGLPLSVGLAPLAPFGFSLNTGLDEEMFFKLREAGAFFLMLVGVSR